MQLDYAIAAQSAGFLGVALNIAMRAMTADRWLKRIGVLAMTVWTLHFLLLKAWVGASCNAIEGAVTLLSLWALPVYGRMGLALLPLLPAPWLVTGFTDSLPILSSVACGFGMMFCEGIALRMVLLLTTGLWLAYDVVSGSLGGTLAELISLGTLIVMIWRMQSARIPQD